MGIFDRLYYGKAGQRDYSEQDLPKNRVSLFFMVLKDHVFDLIKVNAMQLIFWLPFIFWAYLNIAAIQQLDAEAILETQDGSRALLSTLSGFLFVWLAGMIPCIAFTGPSSAGAAYIMRNWARDEHAFLFSDFKDAFKSNWKQALAVSVITSAAPLVAYAAAVYYGGLAEQNLLMLVPLVCALGVALIWTLMLPLIYPMMIGYELRFVDLLKNALLMACARLPHMLAARLLTALPLIGLFAGLYFGSPIAVMVVSLYYLLFGFALSRLIYASFANGIFDRYLNPYIEGAQVGLGLRPQEEEDAYDDEDDEDEEEDD